MHPHRDDLEAPLWEMIRASKADKHTFVNYACLNALLKRVARKAGIKKRVYPHLFRHSRATVLANHLTEAQMKEYLGWVRDSDMASVYIHLSGRDVDHAVLRMHGLKKDEDHEKSQATLCSRCRTALRREAKFCDRCGLVLDLQTAMNLEQKQKGADNLLSQTIHKDPALLQDPKALSEFIQKAVEKQIRHLSEK